MNKLLPRYWHQPVGPGMGEKGVQGCIGAPGIKAKGGATGAERGGGATLDVEVAARLRRTRTGPSIQLSFVSVGWALWWNSGLVEGSDQHTQQ